jgi:hypothetical protein
MSLSLLSEEILEMIAQECAAFQREDDEFYGSTHPLLNRGVEALSRTSSTMRRVCIPVLFGTIMLRGDRDHLTWAHNVLDKIYDLINAAKKRHIAQCIRYV